MRLLDCANACAAGEKQMLAQTSRGKEPAQGERQDSQAAAPSHPRTIGWVGTTALAMGGSNQSLFLIGGAAGLIATQGSAAVPLLILGLLLSWLALPGWIELILMWPKRVGGIAATCAEAFRPISPVLSNLTGVCYWWGWVPTCGLTAYLSAKAINAWFLPMVPAKLLASAIVLFFLRSTCAASAGLSVSQCRSPRFRPCWPSSRASSPS